MEPFIGEIRLFGFGKIPYGWAPCNGQSLAIVQNSALYAVIGLQFGGDGKTFFCLPDLRGRAPLHAGAGQGLTQRRVGDRVGSESVAVTAANMPAHNHAVTAANVRGTSPDPGSLSLAQGGTPSGRDFNPWNTYVSDNAPNVALHTSAIQAAGQAQPHENRQPYLSLNFCIAIVGLFPVRP